MPVAVALKATMEPTRRIWFASGGVLTGRLTVSVALFVTEFVAPVSRTRYVAASDGPTLFNTSVRFVAPASRFVLLNH